MDANTIALIQVGAAIVQGLAAVVIIFVTHKAALKGADRGAQRAYELNEQSALAREAREQETQRGQMEQQLKSVRLLLSLEITQNLNDLTWLRDNLVAVLGEEQEQYYTSEGADAEGDAPYEWFEERQQFIAAHMPDWGHRFWHGQQSSHLLPRALDEMEIRKVNFIHSQLDYLSRIRDMLTERMRGYDESLGQTTSSGEGRRRSASFKADAPHLWSEFVDTLNQILELGNPLADGGPAPSTESLPGATGATRALTAAPQNALGVARSGLRTADPVRSTRQRGEQ